MRRSYIPHLQSILPGVAQTVGASVLVALLGAILITESQPLSAQAADSAYASTILADSPYAYWRLDESNGSRLRDFSGNGHNGVYYGSVRHNATGALTGDSDPATLFDGITASASAPLDLSSTSSITVEFWLKWNSFANDDRLAMELTPNYNASTAGFLVNPNSSDGTFQIDMLGNSGYTLASFARPTAGVFHYYSAVLTHASTGDQIAVYVDGIIVSTQGVTSANTGGFATGRLFFMSRASSSLFGAGVLDEVAIYPRALTASHLLNHYQIGKGAPSSVQPASTAVPPTATATAQPAPTAVASRTGTTYFTGDFETGDWTGFWGVQAGTSITPSNSPASPPPYYELNPARNGQTSASIVASPRPRSGTHALKLETTPAIADGSKSQGTGIQTTAAAAHTGVGDDTYYGFSILFPSSSRGQWAAPQGDWNLFFEFLGFPQQNPPLSGPSGQQVEFGLNTDPAHGGDATNPNVWVQLNVDANGNYVDGVHKFYDPAVVAYDTWTDYVFRVKWASDSTGVFTVWKNGVKIFDVEGVRTAFTGQGDGDNTNVILMNYHQTWYQTMTYYLDALRTGDSYSAVAP